MRGDRQSEGGSLCSAVDGAWGMAMEQGCRACAQEIDEKSTKNGGKRQM